MSLRPTSRTEVRKKSYKTGVDADEGRRRREDNLVEIRKNKREDNLLKKRREGLLQFQQSTQYSQDRVVLDPMKKFSIYLVSQGCIKPLCDFLVYPDPRIVTVCLENILKVGKSDKESRNSGEVNIFAQMIDECEGLDKIENLQSHDNNEIYEKAVKILERYWREDEEEEQNLQDGVDTAQQGFNFGTSEPNLPSCGF